MKAFYHKRLNECYIGNSLTSAYVHFRCKYRHIPGMTPADFEILDL